MTSEYGELGGTRKAFVFVDCWEIEDHKNMVLVYIYLGNLDF
jgi:hypothetical protein